MAINFPYIFANLSGNLPASDLDQNFTYTGTLPSQATTVTAGSYTLTGSETVLINAGSTPYGATLSQIAAATGIGTAAALAPSALATAAQVKTGTNNTQAVTPYSLNQNNQSGVPGYYTLPGGFLMQWGQATSVTAGANGGTITFSQNFTTPPLVIASVSGQAAGNYVALIGALIGTGPYTGSYFTTSLGGSYASGVSINWFAVGK